MNRPISRRDFFDGVGRGVGGAAALGALGSIGTSPADAATGDASYPPALTGDRGQRPEERKTAHALRDGDFWLDAGGIEDTGETYDLVVVGGGISGLAAAMLYRQRVGKNAKVLILEAQGDVGGHAKRNEFTASNGSTLIGYGGSQSLQTPSYFSPAVNALMADLDLDLTKFQTTFYDSNWAEARGLGSAWFFPKEVFGSDALVREEEKAADWVPKAPLSEKAKADLIQLIDSPPDYLAGKSREEKFEQLARTTYRDFLLDIVKADPKLVDIYRESTTAYFGVGIDAATALDAWGNWNPGFGGMDLGDMPYKTMSPSGRLALTDPDPYVYHFPDGNHGIVLALLRALNPAAVSARSMEDLATARIDYGALDASSATARVRLNSTAVRVVHEGDPASASSVRVVYAQSGKLLRVKAAHVVLACWHRVIPYIASELAPEQVAALNDQQKVPLIYTNVQIRNWTAFDKLKIHGFTAPGHFWRDVEIDFPVSMGSYKFAQTPQDPVILHLSKVPLDAKRGPSAREQARGGRALLQKWTFEEIEREIRDLLGRALSGGGFDPARDIEGVTVNRWAHGYAYEYMRPWDQFWPDGPLPIEAARKGWGRIAIANADSGAYAYAHSAIDQAARAVRELVGAAEGAPAFADFPGPPRDQIGLG